MRVVIRTSAALRDIAEAYAYLALHDRRAAASLAAQIDATVRRLARNPELGFLRDDLSSPIFAKLVGHDVIYYQYDEDQVVIVRILHGARDAEGQLP